MEQLELDFDPIPTFKVGVRLKDGEMHQYTIDAVDHAHAATLAKQALDYDEVVYESIIVRVK